MALTIAMIMLSEDAVVEPETFQEFLQTNWPDLGPISEVEAKDETLSCNIGESMVIMAKMPAPIPWSDLEGPCATSLLWENAEQEVKQHKFHWIVTVNADLEPIPLSTLLTQVTSAALAACDAAIGTYWGNATLVLPKKTFVDVATGTLPDELPLLLWVDFRIGPDSEKTSAGFTAGMRALGHMDLETEHATESPRDLYERLVSLADYVLTNGPVIKDGDTVGQDAHEKIRVVYSDSTFGHEEKVMRLVYGKGYDKKPRWKFW